MKVIRANYFETLRATAFRVFMIPTNNQYDIAVILLKDEIVPGDTIEIARLPEENAPCPNGKRLIVSGWGKDMTRYMIRPLDNLWAVSQECLNASSCPFLNDMDPKTNMLCIGDSENSLNSACMGDSGGIFYGNLRLFLVAIMFSYNLFLQMSPILK